MKQSVSSTHIGGIPIDTNTLAGQWMTFSHMANHYRKLLNVKPRIDTGIKQAGSGPPPHNLTTSSSAITLRSSKSSKLARNRLASSGLDIHMLPQKDSTTSSTKRKSEKSRKRHGSAVSIGTICGSEELTVEDFPMSIKDICGTLEGEIMGDDSNDLLLSRIMDDNLYLKRKEKSSSKSRPTQDYSRHRTPVSSLTLHKFSSMGSLVPSGSSGYSGGGTSQSKTKSTAGSTSASAVNGNNKDSSRDSAYGFSSGESRITTRESTPEKRSLHGLLDTSRRRHRESELQQMPCKDKEIKASFPNERVAHSKSSSKSLRHHRHLRTLKKNDGFNGQISKAPSANSLHRQDSSETYITLLAELTQDIVSKGIYTNKGLKSLFKSYMDQNKNLSQDKLAEMLERLRMDLGIPKDDSLDGIEFGYGSVTSATSTWFFYSPPTLQDRLTTKSVILSANKITSSGPSTSPPAPPPPESIQSDSPSPTTIIPIRLPEALTPAATTTTGFSSSGGPNTSSNCSITTTDEGSADIPSDNDNYKHHDGDEEDIGVGKDADDDELSLSETEVTKALKIAGLDVGTMEELVGMLKS